MNGNYCEIMIPSNESLHDALIAELSFLGYDGFEEFPGELKAYIPESQFNENELLFLSNQYQLNYSKSIIKEQNWNAVWESNFEPVRVDDFAGIRAHFHPPFSNVEFEIIITPKMSFGTGHHATTYMMMKLMQELDCKGKSVFDFGTGTGILAILAEKLGAAKVLAVDNDDWCIENASENIVINQCKHIDIQKVDRLIIEDSFDIVLANINRNILLDTIPILQKALVPTGHLLLSGLLQEDEPDITTACKSAGLTHTKTLERNGWIAMRFDLSI